MAEPRGQGREPHVRQPAHQVQAGGVAARGARGGAERDGGARGRGGARRRAGGRRRRGRRAGRRLDAAASEAARDQRRDGRRAAVGPRAAQDGRRWRACGGAARHAAPTKVDGGASGHRDGGGRVRAAESAERGGARRGGRSDVRGGGQGGADADSRGRPRRLLLRCAERRLRREPRAPSWRGRADLRAAGRGLWRAGAAVQLRKRGDGALPRRRDAVGRRARRLPCGGVRRQGVGVDGDGGGAALRVALRVADATADRAARGPLPREALRRG